MRYHRAVKKPALTPAHRKRRREWAERHALWTDEDWNQVLFSDESSIELHSTRKKMGVYRKAAQRMDPKCLVGSVKQSPNLMVWGCFGNGRLGQLSFIDGTMDSTSYIRILRPALPAAKREVFDGGDFVFQQDNASCHKSRMTMRWFQRHNFQVLDWPAQSPDLNPIENLWATLKRKVDAKRPFKNMAALREAAKAAWSEIGEDELCNLLSSMPLRVRLVREAKGGTSEY